MQSRLIGTDSGLDMIANASASVASTAAKASEAARDSTADFLNQSQQRAKQLLDLQTQMEVTKAQRPVSNSLASSVETIGKLLIQREQEKAKAAQVKEQQTNLLKGTRLKAAIETNQQQKKAEALANKQAQEDNQLLLYGDTEAQLTSLYQSEPGVERYRSQSSKLIADAMDKGLSPENVVKLMQKVNQTANERYDKRSERLAEETQKIQDTRTDQLAITTQLKLQPSLAAIRNLPPTEQAAPYLQHIERELKSVLADQSLTQEQKFRVANSVLSEVNKAYGTKADAYAKYNTGLNNLSEYITYMRQARAKFEADGNLDDYKGARAYAKQVYGDWEDALAQPGEIEKFQAEVATDINTRDRLRQEGLERLGINLDISEQETQMLAKRMLTNPAYLLQMKNSPEFKNNRSVQAAVSLAEDYEKYSKEKADLEDEKAANGVQYANLNLSIANNRAQLIERMARVTAAATSGKQMTAQQQAELEFNQRVLKDLPELQFIVDSMAQKLNAGGNIDPNELKKASDLTEQGLINVMSAMETKQRIREKTLVDRYPALQQYGMLKPRDVLTREAQREQKALDEKMENYRNLIRQQQTQSQQPTQYGQQSPFDGASTYGAEVDARGLLKLAPRQRLNKVDYNGSTIVTPVVAGSGSPITSRWKAPRGGGTRQHAGADFGANNGVYSVALVSGQVVHIGNDPEGYGGFMDILGDNGKLYRYGHQGGFKFKPGQRVRAGDLVSYSDGSGVGPPHLHFEVHPNPKFANGSYVPQFGIAATEDPLEHLRKLSANDSSVLQPRVNNRAVARLNPRMKVPNNAAVFPQGAALQANSVQFIGGDLRSAANVYNNQRPVRTGSLDWNIGNPNNIRYDYDDDFGYSQLRNNTKLRRAITAAAKELKVPAVWIADIIRQETGAEMSHRKIHNAGRNYGLFGFGSDSFRDVTVAQMKQMDEEQQMKLMVRYMKENGWLKHLQKRGGETSISEFWSIMRMGVNWRNQVLRDPIGFLSKKLDDTGRLWGDEIGLLGKWAGRSYSIPGRNNNRKQRNSAVQTQQHAGCKLCQQMLLSGSDVLAHVHDIA